MIDLTRNADKKLEKVDRSYYYWIRKPYKVYNTLLALEDGEFLTYVDAGCQAHVSEDAKKLFEQLVNFTRKFG